MTQTYRILYNNGDVAYFAIGSSGVFYGTAQSSLEKLTYSSHGLTWAITPFGRFQHTEPDGPEWLTLHSAKCLNSSSIKTNVKTPEEDRTVILRIIADGDTEAYLRLDMVTRRAYYGDTLQNLSACQTRWEGHSDTRQCSILHTDHGKLYLPEGVNLVQESGRDDILSQLKWYARHQMEKISPE